MTDETPEVEAEVTETPADDEPVKVESDDEPVKVESDDEVLAALIAEEEAEAEILGATPAEEAPEPEPEPDTDETPYEKYARLLDEGYKRSQLRSICNGKGTLIAVELA